MAEKVSGLVEEVDGKKFKVAGKVYTVSKFKPPETPLVKGASVEFYADAKTFDDGNTVLFANFGQPRTGGGGGGGSRKSYTPDPKKEQNIIRENALTNATNYSIAKGKSVPELLQIAEKFEEWVNRDASS